MDGEEFGHVGIYSIIDEFIYPIPVGTVHTPNSGRRRPRPSAPTAHCDTVETHSLAPMSTIVQPRCGVKVRARLPLLRRRRDDGWKDAERKRRNENVYIYLWMAGGRSRVARVEQRRGGMPNAHGRRKGVASDVHLSVRDSIPCSATGVPTTGE